MNYLSRLIGGGGLNFTEIENKKNWMGHRPLGSTFREMREKNRESHGETVRLGTGLYNSMNVQR